MTVKRWAYMLLFDELSAIVPALNRAGADGWEAFFVTYAGDARLVVWLRRPEADDPASAGEQ